MPGTYISPAETGLYYLQSRYYDPVTCRFINADSLLDPANGYNLFAYCGNNPVNMVDEQGTCFYDAKGNWCHDNWEYIGGYERKPEPLKNTNIKIVQYSEHKKKGSTNPANKNKHQKGQTRKQKDNRGEKGDARRKPNPNKRNNANNFAFEPVLEYKGDVKVAVISTALVYILANDATGVGIIDDVLVPPLIYVLICD